MKRKIPSVMVSQHPDNAGKPYWHTEAYISDQHEVKECFLAFSKLGVAEYKWDWEGKFVEESVFERLVSEYPTFFQKHPIGKEKFLTFRLPDYRVKTEFRLARALMALITAAGLAKEVGLHSPPLFEVILSMTQSAEEIIGIQEAYVEMSQLAHILHKNNRQLQYIEIIPLFESINAIISSDKILKKYIQLHKEKFGFKPFYMRPYLARSDSALSSGLIPSVLAIKLALSSYQSFEKNSDIPLYPILGAGSLPFRGGSTPYAVSDFTKEYKGIKTMLVQSAFQYDFPVVDVIAAIKKIDKLLSKSEATSISPLDRKKILDAIPFFESPYKETIKKIGPLVYSMAVHIPPRRERLKHTGLLKYPRTLEGVKIPRAINFTASLYSLGVPPELIGTGRGIRKLRKLGKLSVVEKYYIGFKNDLERAGKYLNKEVLRKLARKSSAFSSILEDVREIEDYLGHDLTPETVQEKAHGIYTSEIYERFIDSVEITELIEEAAVLRRSLG